MTSGHVFALRARHRLSGELDKFIDQGKLIMGVCNGFQIMVKLGLLPGLDDDYFTQKLSIIQNDCGTFQNRWVRLRFESDSPCVFTRGLDFMPSRSGMGKGKVFTLDKSLLQRLEARGASLPLCGSGNGRADAGISAQSERLAERDRRPVRSYRPHLRTDAASRRRTCIRKITRNGNCRNCAARCPTHGLGLRFFRNAVDHLKNF